MRSQLRALLAVLALGFASPHARAADIYVLTNNSLTAGSATTNFGKINSTTGAYTSIASLTGDVWNLAWNPAAGNFFVTKDNSFNDTLHTLTTTGTLSGSLGSTGHSIYGMAYRTVDSKLYAYTFDQKTGTIDTANGTWTILNNSNAGPATPNSLGSPKGGRYTIMNDTMYLCFFDGNQSTGNFGTMGYTAVSTFQQTTTNPLYGSSDLANDGTTMYGIYGNFTAGQQKLYTINPASGAMTAGPSITGASLGTVFHGAAMVPEPSTWILAAIASGVMAAAARRRLAKGKG